MLNAKQRFSQVPIRTIVFRSATIFLILALSFIATIANEVRNFARNDHNIGYQNFEFNVVATARFSDAIFDSVINQPRILALMQQAHSEDSSEVVEARQSLYEALQPLYETLRDADIQQLHFHTRTNHSFLRFHRPSLYGDDLTGIRSTVEYVNATQTPFHGFEEGRVFNGFRHVYPLIYQNEHVGSVEISNSLASFKRVYELSQEDTVDFVLFRGVVESKVFEEELSNYHNYALSPHLLLQNELIELDLESPIIDYQEKQRLLQRFADRRGVVRAIENHTDYFGVAWFNNRVYSIKLNVLRGGVNREPVGFAVSLSNYNYIKESLPGHILQLSLFLLISIAFAWVLYRQRRLMKGAEHLARYDGLTGLMNRRYFSEVAIDTLTQNENPPKSRFYFRRKPPWVKRDYSLIMFDIDHFKKINDQFGHDVGDKALEFMARLIKEQNQRGDTYCRWGGEEFMALVRGKVDKAQEKAEFLRALIEERTEREEGIPGFTCSFGVVETDKNIPWDKQLTDVDHLLYKAKENGRNRVEG
ncbi:MULTISPECIES: diguanylate cyclase domain-containing protein [Gammaproteobacteria]|uniref:diguanylate cyclase domain-containing protein n=1 Tax=Gammaproteobacteria TaxID=1236 RepID=UPI000DD0303F|nr:MULTISPECIES: diguanylate cyclase [Gammaproteobacteria]RTE85888.1 diguanylate cyclase [Aliidiomarina sp. B3213]TCZ90111.1 diguanylate cyclase [Lysobacter sp. N42]